MKGGGISRVVCVTSADTVTVRIGSDGLSFGLPEGDLLCFSPIIYVYSYIYVCVLFT